MLSLQIFIIIALIGAGYFIISKFNQHCLNQFDHAFFTKTGFYIVTIAVLLFYYGSKWIISLDTDISLNGSVLILAGSLVSFYLVYQNIKSSSVMYGLIGSFLQLSLFGIIAYQSIPFLFLFLICVIVGGIPQPRINNIYHY